MGRLERIINAVFGYEDKPVESQSKDYNSSSGADYGVSYPIINKTWDGEKTTGELGIIMRNIPDYERLRLRALDAYTKTDIVKLITSRSCDWTIGMGLKLQCEPNKQVLESEGINVSNISEFKKKVESRFSVYSKSKYSSYDRQSNLHKLAYDFYKAKDLQGDCLAICRVENGLINVQFISGSNVKTPLVGSKWIDQLNENNYIEHGIEFNERGEHISYYVEKKVKNGFNEFERVEVYGKNSKRKLAWMVYGERITPDHLRAIPKISQSLEKINKLDRYSEAAVSKAENAAKFVGAIEHDLLSTGENPLTDIVNRKAGILKSILPNDYKLADENANEIRKSTSGTVVNMIPGSKLKSFDTQIETNYEQFEKANFNRISASSNLPPEVALQSYNSNYSASRAAIIGWEFMVEIERNEFVNNFYIPFYSLWLEVEVLKNKINAPGLINAIRDNDVMVIEAYTSCRFIGKKMPHIDPLKEVKAARSILGDDTTPLRSREQVAEDLGYGDFETNYMSSLEEDKYIVKEEVVLPNNKN